MDLRGFFKCSSVAVIGVSSNPNKIGHVIFKNLLESEYKGNVYAVNPKLKSVINRPCYKNVLEIDDKLELAVIAIPAKKVIDVVSECGKKKIKNVVIISSGFSEVGNHKLEEELLRIIKKYKIRLVGPNVLGVFDSYSGLDTLFLPRLRLNRPKKGGISFICQSGAVGSATLDMVARQGYGFSKFISYGNAIDVNESDILEYLGKDNETKVICLYVEGIKNGKDFIKIARSVSKKKPIIAIKGGITKEGSEAVISHTGSLGGSAEIYKGVFKQAGIIEVESLEDLFDYAKVLDKCIKPKGKNIQVITNGGGYGILCTDWIARCNLNMAKFSKITGKKLKKLFRENVILKNPIDLLGDARTKDYSDVLRVCLKDNNIDILLVVVLYQTPLISSDIVDIITESNNLKEKPIIVISTGGNFTEIHKTNLENEGVPCFNYPDNGVKAISALVEYYHNIKK